MAMQFSSRIRNNIALFHDALMAAASFVLALWLRLGAEEFAITHKYLPLGVALFTLICVSVFVSQRMYRGIWRYASLQDLVTITKSVTLAHLVFLACLFMFTRLEDYPRSVLFVNWLLLLVMLGGPRFLYRFMKDGRLELDLHASLDARVPVLLVGAGANAELFLRETARFRDSHYRVVALVDDDPAKIGRTIQGLPIYGPVENLSRVLEKLARKGKPPRKIILTQREFDNALARKLLEIADRYGAPLARLPDLTAFKEGFEEKEAIKPVAIEDILGRPQNTLDREAMRRLVAGRRVLVTGAGGTIGGELSRQIAGFAPAALTLLDHSEYALYSIDREIGESFAATPRHAALCDVRDRESLKAVFAAAKPEIVFHAAAIKHVPIAEENPAEAVKTNIFGTINVAECSKAANALAMVLISTDKAVHPTSLMGTTKRVAELYVQSQNAGGGATRFIAVRFGNVLGSTGSVVPLFARQIAAGGPVTVTHPDMVRYFMTVREAVGLVLQAAAAGVEGSEGAGTYVLEMGEQVRIEDLALQMIRLAGLRPHQDIQIVHTGLRAGEKLYEELFYAVENPRPTAHAGIMKAAPQPVEERHFRERLEFLRQQAAHGGGAAIRNALAALVPEYIFEGGAEAATQLREAALKES